MLDSVRKALGLLEGSAQCLQGRILLRFVCSLELSSIWPGHWPCPSVSFTVSVITRKFITAWAQLRRDTGFWPFFSHGPWEVTLMTKMMGDNQN